MTPRSKTHRRTDASPSASRRPVWRQRLVEAERGAALGFRGDSTLFVHFFTGCVIVAAAIVLHISLTEWAVLVLAMSVVLAAEMFNKALGNLTRHMADESRQSSRPLSGTFQIGTAAVFVTMAGALVSMALVFSRPVMDLFSG